MYFWRFKRCNFFFGKYYFVYYVSNFCICKGNKIKFGVYFGGKCIWRGEFIIKFYRRNEILVEYVDDFWGIVEI